jgi:hypothetical protein
MSTTFAVDMRCRINSQVIAAAAVDEVFTDMVRLTFIDLQGNEHVVMLTETDAHIIAGQIQVAAFNIWEEKQEDNGQ